MAEGVAGLVMAAPPLQVHPMRIALALALGSAVLLPTLGGFFWQNQPVKATATPPPAGSSAAPLGPIPVEAHVVEERPFVVKVKASGTLLPRESVELVSELTRRLVRVRAQEGAQVKQGEVLFELDSADLVADLQKREVELSLAKITLDRQQQLVSQGLSPQQELDSARASYDRAVAEREVVRVAVSRTLIRAPFSGTLGLRRVSEGAWLTPSTVLTTLQDTTTLKLDFTLPERYVGLLPPGSEFDFSIAGHGKPFKGKVLAQEPSVNAATRSLLVRGVVTSHPELAPGSFAAVEIPLRTERARLVPAIAVIPGVEGRRVFAVRGGHARAVRVEVGETTTDSVQILSGVSPGDKVIVSNLLRIKDGSPVRVVPKGSR